MTILTLHEKECYKIAKEILNNEIQNPITAEVSTDRGEATYLIFLDGRELAKGLELKVKKELEKSDLSDTYVVEFDFNKSIQQNKSLYFEKIIESSIIYQVPQHISESEQLSNKLKELCAGKIPSYELLKKELNAVKMNPKAEMEFLDLIISSLTIVENNVGLPGPELEQAGFIQRILPNGKPFELPKELSDIYSLSQVSTNSPSQFISKRMTTENYTFPKFKIIETVFLYLFLLLTLKFSRQKVNTRTVEYQTVAEYNEEQYHFINWARFIVEKVDEEIPIKQKFYYTRKELEMLIE